MRISVADAKGQLTELVRRAEQGDEIVLTRQRRAAVRLVPVKVPLDRQSPPGASRSDADRWRSQGENRA